MATDVFRTPPSSGVHKRYPHLFHKKKIQTQKELRKGRLLQLPACGLFPKTALKHQYARHHHLPIMSSPDVRLINFFKSAKPRLSPVYNPQKDEDYLSQAFTMTQCLGCGSFGVVVGMMAKEDGHRYAIKYQNEYKSHFNRYEQLREVVFLQYINHPNCVRFYLAWEEKDRLHIQTELCEQNLTKFLAIHDGNVPEPRVWDVLLDLLRGLAYLHKNFIVHLDVKPDNVLLDHLGIAKLSDFGMAFDLQTDNHNVCRIEGDARFLASEALNDTTRACVTTKRDIFSLGVTILQLATDVFIPPYGDEAEDIRNFRLPDNLLCRMSDELRGLLAVMMSRDMNARPEASWILETAGIYERELDRRDFVQMASSNYAREGQGDVFLPLTPRCSNWIGNTLAALRTEYHARTHAHVKRSRSTERPPRTTL
ncbi:Protein kinase domain-containing protein [Aphelenchoides fujianensis]|nr:Protein kinase domain-containing protein [Aphelenchoides fujianensis]